MSDLKIHLLGNVMLGRMVNERLKDESPDSIWGDTLPVLRDADCRVCNLESVISDLGSRWSASPKLYHFRSDAIHVSALKAGGINVVSLANNHALDFDDAAMLNMLQLLDDAGIAHCGAGPNLVAAAEPAILRVRDRRIGFISFTDSQPEWTAGPEKPGVFHIPINVRNQEASLLFELVRYTRQQVDFLIVSPHWGGNWGSNPPPEHREFAQALIEKGADVIFGHSPHLFRGIEVYQRKPIIYAAGNFIDDYVIDADERNDWSFIYSVQFEDGAVERVALTPTIIRCCQAELAKGIEADAIRKKMTELCGSFGTVVKRVGSQIVIDLKHTEHAQNRFEQLHAI